MKVGIPRALLYYYYIPFWKKFFEELNVEVVISEETSKTVLNKGIKHSVAEICVPIKLFVGHLVTLAEKDIDYLFVPRMISISEGEYFCPKFLGLPDLVKHSIDNMETRMLTCHIKSKDDDISDYTNYLSLAEPLGVTEKQIKKAAKTAGSEWKAFRAYNKMGYTFHQSLELVNAQQKVNIKANDIANSVQIGLLGYPYNIYDNFINMDLFEKIDELNVDFITFDMLDEVELTKQLEHMDKKLFWTFSNKLLGAGYKLFSEGKVDGIIHITAFGCGPDSFLSRLMELESDATGIPFMIIRIDEHTGENHLLTRIEAFVDMIKRKKAIS